jgi:hypothetical protein
MPEHIARAHLRRERSSGGTCLQGFKEPSSQTEAWRTVDRLVVGHREDLRLPRVGLVAQVGPGGVADAGGDAAVQQRLQQDAGSSRSQAQQTAHSALLFG